MSFEVRGVEKRFGAHVALAGVSLRVARGELRAAFSALTTIAEGEAGGRAWLLAKA